MSSPKHSYGASRFVHLRKEGVSRGSVFNTSLPKQGTPGWDKPGCSALPAGSRGGKLGGSGCWCLRIRFVRILKGSK